jgi:arylsulfatase A-like enzyme
MSRRELLRLTGTAAAGLLTGRLLVGAGQARAGSSPSSASAPGGRPNILYILADDLGYGDVKCLNPDGKIATPNLGKLAGGGICFTDAHSSSAVCTPTRYGILTGRYNWRSRLKSGVLSGLSPRLIEPDRLTVPALLKKHGYATACLGKWHLGMDWPLKKGPATQEDRKGEGWNVDYAKPIKDGPTAVGFDYFYGISASLDMPPYVFIENDLCQGLPTVEKTWIRKGPAHKDFEAIDVLPTLTRKAVDYIDRRADKAKAGEPFFLYLALTAPHTPIVPTADWQGKSGLNAYGDFVMQVDWTVGQVLRALDRNGLTESTLVIFTSDNGCSPAAKVDQLQAKGHYPSYHFRGYKADIFDGGHRIPFIARWPGKIKPGSTSDQLICLNDLMATCAEIVAAKLPDSAGEDSVSILPALLGKASQPLREAVVHHSINGSFSIRQGKWKLELCPDSGGWSAPRPGSAEAAKLPTVQLYDLSGDAGEKTNVQDQHPDVVERLTKLLEKYVADGRSTPGAPQRNTGEVNIRRVTKDARKQAATIGAVDKE